MSAPWRTHVDLTCPRESIKEEFHQHRNFFGRERVKKLYRERFFTRHEETIVSTSQRFVAAYGKKHNFLIEQYKTNQSLDEIALRIDGAERERERERERGRH